MAVAVAGFYPQPTKHPPLMHRASFHGRGNRGEEGNESGRLSHSLPGSPADWRPNFGEVVGSAESLVGRVLVQQGLGRYCDPDFVRCTSKEMQEALDMTAEEMDRAAHRILLQEKQGRPLSFQPNDNLSHNGPRL